MGIITMGPDFRLVHFIKEKYHITNFIETGTYKGVTSEWASKIFDNVFSVELSKYWFNKTKDNLKNIRNIEFLLGNSKDILPTILGSVDNAILWLDAHWCGDNSAGENNLCPIVEELEIINSFSGLANNLFIMIDDARLFLSPPPLPHSLNEYPDLQTIIHALNKQRKVYIFNDIIVAIPKEYNKEFDELFQNLSTQEKTNLSNKPTSIKIQVLKKLKKYIEFLK